MSESDSEEEILMVVEFDQPVPPPSDGNEFKVLGLDSDNPIVQYQKQVFRGQWQDTVGTKVLFKEQAESEVKDSLFSPETPRMYEYADQTRKVLRLYPYVLSKTEEQGEPSTRQDGAVQEGLAEKGNPGEEGREQPFTKTETTSD